MECIARYGKKTLAVIPGLIRDPVILISWIPVSAGMTMLEKELRHHC
jgi:hypothetical protein